MEFKILLERITPALKRIARKHVLCGFYDEDDLYQEMCLFLWQRYAEGLPIGINEAYVVKGCEFHILNYLRKGRGSFRYVSLNTPLSSEGKTLADTIEDPHANFVSSSDTHLTIDDIKRKNLSPKEHQVLSCLIKGYTVREIAQRMQISHVMVIKHKKNIIRKANLKNLQG